MDRFLGVVLLSAAALLAQDIPNPPQAAAGGSAAPVAITLQNAIQRAQALVPEFRAAVTDAAVAREDRVQARAALLPSVNYTTQYLYTQGNRTATPVFIANNAVHEYVSQGNAHETLGLSGEQIGEFRRARAAEALARARQEAASRGLVMIVVQRFYDLVVTQRKQTSAQAAQAEAERFLKIGRQLEQGGEVAKSDVIKAQLQFNDSERALRETALALDKARLALAVILFPDFNQDFTVVDDLSQARPLPGFADAQKMAANNNPDSRAAFAGVQVAEREVQVAWAGHFPTLSLDVWYGIDANRFATYTDGVRNLGYSAAATLNVPIWSWGATQSKVKQAQLRRQQARVELSFAQRQAMSNLRAFFAEAETAQGELENLHNSAELAAESLRLTTLRYQGGEATALEVVDAQNTLVQARNASDDGEARYRQAIAQLQTLTGMF